MPKCSSHAFNSLWADKGVQIAILKGNEHSLHDNLSYFFKDFERLFDRDYLPTDQDIRRMPLRTTGIRETIFGLGNLTYRILDVSGQRSERKKWIHLMDNVQVLLFLVPLSSYNETLVDYLDINKLQEALMQFKQVANSKYFEKAVLILFLDGVRLFLEKIVSGIAPLSRYFPDYQGKENDPGAAQEFIAGKFRSVVWGINKEVYIHYTDSSDTNLVKKTMNSVKDTIMQRNLASLLLK